MGWEIKFSRRLLSLSLSLSLSCLLSHRIVYSVTPLCTGEITWSTLCESLVCMNHDRNGHCCSSQWRFFRGWGTNTHTHTKVTKREEEKQVADAINSTDFIISWVLRLSVSLVKKDTWDWCDAVSNILSMIKWRERANNLQQREINQWRLWHQDHLGSKSSSTRWEQWRREEISISKIYQLKVHDLSSWTRNAHHWESYMMLAAVDAAAAE